MGEFLVMRCGKCNRTIGVVSELFESDPWLVPRVVRIQHGRKTVRGLGAEPARSLVRALVKINARPHITVDYGDGAGGPNDGAPRRYRIACHSKKCGAVYVVKADRLGDVVRRADAEVIAGVDF